MRYLVALLLIFSSFIAQAGTINPRAGDEKYIEYGKKHECVVKISGEGKDNKRFFGSAVIFKPRWFLTAAHVVKDAKNCIILHEETPVKVDYIAVHSDYKEDNFGKYDIALGYLSEECNIDFYPQLYTGDDEVGKICSISGYGITGSFYGDERFSDNKKRAGSNIVTSLDRDLLICTLKDKHTSLEFLICWGDSGGGLFIDKKLAGINSCTMTDDKNVNSDIGDESGHTRVSLFVDWIERAMKAVEESARIVDDK